MKFCLFIFVYLGIHSAAFAQQADLVMTIGGDVNFTKNLWEPNSAGVGQDPKKVIPFDQLTRGLLPLIQGADINFANIETVVTETALSASEKEFNFQTHPAAIQHLIDIGYNMFSLANNHSHDYGVRGVEQSLFHFRQFERSRAVAHSGLGANLEEATSPHVFMARGVRIGFLSFGNTSFYPTDKNAGVLSYNREEHLALSLAKLKNADVDLRIVSIHTGTERETNLDSGQRRKFARILEMGNVNLIIGHHPHVVRPIEFINGRMIFYSLGNYLMTGSANITQNGLLQDYGLMAKIYFKRDAETQQMQITAVQGIPLTNTHRNVQQMSPAESRKRIVALNELSVRNVSEHALLFEVHEDTGTGKWKKN
jgi:poly-gamma-glutamate capsule biosynthesis protein CapA/YwtB (metallophosphatase superfamily)